MPLLCVYSSLLSIDYYFTIIIVDAIMIGYIVIVQPIVKYMVVRVTLEDLFYVIMVQLNIASIVAIAGVMADNMLAIIMS